MNQRLFMVMEDGDERCPKCGGWGIADRQKGQSLNTNPEKKCKGCKGKGTVKKGKK